ncbi:hypothetical protein E2C01_024571 [Portunus trituberculatus]|uniref:Uncharacterized protein n=1 Tax=Portunus trituberculatus TaxID=210409 RepID=A0A5B7ED74_PORTR|nr:hypothetical protein [Portunus trituberculatus]
MTEAKDIHHNFPFHDVCFVRTCFMGLGVNSEAGMNNLSHALAFPDATLTPPLHLTCHLTLTYANSPSPTTPSGLTSPHHTSLSIYPSTITINL